MTRHCAVRHRPRRLGWIDELIINRVIIATAIQPSSEADHPMTMMMQRRAFFGMAAAGAVTLPFELRAHAWQDPAPPTDPLLIELQRQAEAVLAAVQARAPEAAPRLATLLSTFGAYMEAKGYDTLFRERVLARISDVGRDGMIGLAQNRAAQFAAQVTERGASWPVPTRPQIAQAVTHVSRDGFVPLIQRSVAVVESRSLSPIVRTGGGQYDVGLDIIGLALSGDLSSSNSCSDIAALFALFQGEWGLLAWMIPELTPVAIVAGMGMAGWYWWIGC